MEKLKEVKNKEEVLKAAVEIISEKLGLSEEDISILIYNPSEKLLEFVHPPELVGAGAIPSTAFDSIAAKVFKSKEGFMFNNFQNVKHLSFFEKLSKRKEPIKKLIAVPIIKGNEALGVIEVSRRDEKNFTQDDLSFMEQMGEMLGEKLMELIK